jgi:type IV pilus assembly protein PilM
VLSGLFNALGIRQSLVGVDLGANALKVVHFSPGRRGPVLQHASLTELIHTDGEGQDRGELMALYDTVRSGRLNRKKMAIAYKGEELTVRHLTFPKMPRNEFKEAMRWEAKKMVPKTLDEVVFDFLTMGEIDEREIKRYEILLVIADRASILGQLEALKPFRSQIRAMDVNPLALLNTVRLNYPGDLADNLAFIDIGAQKMDINIAKKGILRFYRHVRMGGEGITNALMQSLQADYTNAERIKRESGLAATPEGETDNRIQSIIKAEVDKMILEVQRSIDYYRAQYREAGVRKIILMGGTPLMPDFPDYFASYFDAEVVLDNPFAGVICDPSKFSETRSFAPRFSTGVGLCLRKGGG